MKKNDEFFQPPIYIRFDEIDNVNFARASSKQKSFEFHIATKQGQSHIFGTIDRPEYGNLFDFVKEHGLKIRNIKGQEGKLAFDKGDSDEGNSDFFKLPVIKKTNLCHSSLSYRWFWQLPVNWWVVEKLAHFPPRIMTCFYAETIDGPQFLLENIFMLKNVNNIERYEERNAYFVCHENFPQIYF